MSTILLNGPGLLPLKYSINVAVDVLVHLPYGFSPPRVTMQESEFPEHYTLSESLHNIVKGLDERVGLD